MSTTAVPINVYAEMTPNPSTMKFVADKMLVENGAVVEYDDPDAVENAPLAAELFRFPFVDALFFAGNFVSVAKNDLVEWEDITQELRVFIREYLAAGKPIFTAPVKSVSRETERGVEAAPTEVVPQNATEEQIVNILEEYVRPAVENDGGAIHFKSFNDGVLTLVLRGACSGCPSSMITLKGGIEGLMKRFVPEVKEVVAEEQ